MFARCFPKGSRAVVTVILSCAALGAGCQKPPAPTPDGPPSISGVITRIDSQGRNMAQLLVEANPDEASGSDKASIKVTPATRITRRSGHIPFSAGDLRTGQNVSAWFTGPVAESYPVQATAGALLVEDVPTRPAPSDRTTPREEEPQEPEPDPSGETETPEGEPPDGAEEPSGVGPGTWTQGIVDRPSVDGRISVLTGVREASHAGHDRVVFEFQGTTRPGYHVEYVDRPVTECGSGEAVSMAGDAGLEIRLTPAQAHTDAGQPTVTSRNRTPRFPIIEQIRLTCDFEGHVTWVLGVSSPHQYQVLELSNPTRLVVDVQH